MNNAAAGGSCVATVLVTFNPLGVEFAEVLRLHALCRPAYFVVVDNGSANADEVAVLVDQFFTGQASTLVRNPTNLGLGAALNQGIGCAHAQGCTHVAIFDQDSRPKADTLTDLLGHLLKLQGAGRRVGAIGPSQYDLRTGAEYPQRRLYGWRLQTLWPSLQPQDALEVSFIITSGTLLEVAVFEAVGPMREDFFIDSIDIEWCFRAGALGFEVICIKSVRMGHAIGDTRKTFMGRELSIHSPLRNYYMLRNQLYMVRVPTVPMRFRLVEAGYAVARIPLLLVLVGFAPGYFKHIALGLLHGLIGRLGPLR
jgi:rhamnosyltransferase